MSVDEGKDNAPESTGRANWPRNCPITEEYTSREAERGDCDAKEVDAQVKDLAGVIGENDQGDAMQVFCVRRHVGRSGHSSRYNATV